MTGYESVGAGMDACYAYLFAAKAIQPYILDSGPLRDLVGASDLIATLAVNTPDATRPDLIGLVLAALGLEDGKDVRFSRRGGGAFCVHADTIEPLARLRALWRLTVGLHCPGLECAHAGPAAGADDIEAMNRAYAMGTAVRENTAAGLLPGGHPFTEFNRRTGRVITCIQTYKDGPVAADMLTAPQRRRAQALQGSLDGVASRFLEAKHHADGRPFVFPRNLDTDAEDTANNPAFPFAGDDRRIAVIHADLSGLGQVFQNVSAVAKDVATARAVSTAIETAVEAAAQAATAATLLPGTPWPNAATPEQHIIAARPVVLGGDDITVLVRADLAVAFTRALLAAIEQHSATAFATLKPIYPSLSLPPRLSACAGIAVVNAGAPFLMAHALAEGLCRFAKTVAKTVAKQGTQAYSSYLAFHNAQSTLREDYGDIHKREMTANGVRLTANPYRIGGDDAPESLARLTSLGKILNAHPRGSGKLIEAAGLLFTAPALARHAWVRWRDVLKADDKAVLAAIDKNLPCDQAGEPVFEDSIGLLSDALELADLGGFDNAPAGAASEAA